MPLDGDVKVMLSYFEVRLHELEADFSRRIITLQEEIELLLDKAGEAVGTGKDTHFFDADRLAFIPIKRRGRAR